MITFLIAYLCANVLIVLLTYSNYKELIVDFVQDGELRREIQDSPSNKIPIDKKDVILKGLRDPTTRLQIIKFFVVSITIFVLLFGMFVVAISIALSLIKKIVGLI